MIKTYQNHIFDFDGTICNLDVDWIALKTEVYNRFCTRLHLKSRKLIDMVSLIYSVPQYKLELIDLIKFSEQPNGKIFYRNVNYQLIDKFQKFYIISNNHSETIEMVLHQIGVLHKCKCILGIDRVSQPKPSVNPFVRLQELCDDIVADNTIYIGDSDVDRLFSLNCGLKFIHVREA